MNRLYTQYGRHHDLVNQYGTLHVVYLCNRWPRICQLFES